MAKNVCNVLGIKNVDLYMKDNEYFLKVTYNAQKDNGDIYECITDGVILHINHGDGVLMVYDDDPNDMDATPIPEYLTFGKYIKYCLAKDSVTTERCIEKYVRRCTIEDLEKELGYHLEIVSNDEKNNESEEN